MAKTREAKIPSPSSHDSAPRMVHVEDSMIKPSQTLVVSPLVEGTPLRRYETNRPPTTPGASSSRPKKSVSRPPKKKARISAPVEPWPMVTQPLKEGNLDCRARPFHYELCFDRETFRLQPELRNSFHLLQRYYLEHLMTPRDFLYPRVALDFYQSMTAHRVRDPTVIHFTIDGCHELGVPAGPNHPEIPQPEHPEEPQSVEIHADMRAPAPTVPSTGPMHEVASSAPPTTLRTLPVIPAASEPPSSESGIAISISEFRGLCHTLQTLTATQSILTQQIAAIRAHQDQLIPTQTQHTAILRQIQQHLGILSPLEHDIPIPSEPTDPSQDPSLAEQTMPLEETTTREIEASIPSTQTSTTEPSSPHDPPTTI
uniref:Uncharacterized protein n=1 Tax=Vitis vinifera TaxID=29760 RepID=A5AQM7_VITVI|nr:hypothetical protein VITISV_018311 [Vitis vinifera]